MISSRATPTCTVSVFEGVSAREFDGEWVVLDLQNGNYYGLDELGGIVWQHLAAWRSPREIAMLLVPRYEATEEAILKDVLCLVDELLERGLVRMNP